MLLQSPAQSAFFDWRSWLAPRRELEFHAANRAIRLEGQQHLKLNNAAGTLVQVVCGAAWITQEGDIKDSFLTAGECFRVDREGETLIAPLSSVSLRLLSSQPGREAALALLPAGGLRTV